MKFDFGYLQSRSREARLFGRARRGMIFLLLLIMFLVGAAFFFAARPQDEAPAEARARTEATPRLMNEAQREAAGVKVAALQPAPLPRSFKAPGEVRVNDYTTGTVSPRIGATVIDRKAKLGDHVAKGQPLITLYSRDMAEAQSALLLADRNLRRLQKLKDILAGQQIDEATLKRKEAVGRLESYGLEPKQVTALITRGLDNDGLGQFVLMAPRDGTITKDAFRIGDVVEAGKTLFEIADLRTVWVEARVAPGIVPQITDTQATISVGGAKRRVRVVQKADIVDEATRTVVVRLEADNADRSLRPGQFVDVELYGSPEPVLAVPADAVLRNAEGKWGVFVEDSGGALLFKEVKLLYTADGKTAIDGIEPGTLVVTAGAFFVMSEASKSSFGEKE